MQHTWMHIQDIHTCTCTCMCAVHAREVCISHVHIVAVTALASPKRCHPVVAVTTYRIAKHSWALRRPGEQNWPETKNVTWTCPHGHTRNSLYWKTRTPLKRRRDQHATEVRTEERQRAHLRRHGACTRPASLPASPVDLAGSPQAWCSLARLGLHGRSGSQLDSGSISAQASELLSVLAMRARMS